MTRLRRLARGLGYDLVPWRKAKALPAQLNAVLEHFGVTCVLDVGANRGQYASGLREWGYRGRIVSFEPLAEAHAALCTHAASDPGWQVAARTAIGEREGEVELEVSAESDMSSLLPQARLLRRISPSSRILRRETVPVCRLDVAAEPYLHANDRVFLKSDTQGYEARVLDGAAGLQGRLVGLQLELSLVPLYEGEKDFRAMLDHLAALGFVPYLFLPGYFERKLARQLQVDGVFMRASAGRDTPADDADRPEAGTAEEAHMPT